MIQMIPLFRRRRALSVLPLAVLLTAATCDGTRDVACDRAPIQTLVFVDQSASSVVNAATKKMFDDTIAGVLGTSLGCKGDAVHGFLVHAGTRGKVERQDAINEISRPDVESLPKLQKLKAQSDFDQKSVAFAELARMRMSSLFSAEVAPDFKRHTDMLGSLEVISDELAHADSDIVRVYYLGDMHESMPGSRNFDARLPGSVAEARQWADADTALLNQMQIRRERFKNAHIRVLLGNLALKPGMPELRAYWERLFVNAGFHPDSIVFN